MAESFELPLAVSSDSLRRLASGLLFERGQADGTVKRLARNRVREEERRSRWERTAARAEALPGAADISARIEITRTLLDAVERLSEPYREPIVLHFFDDLPPR